MLTISKFVVGTALRGGMSREAVVLKSGRDPWIDVLRAVASIWVVLFHLNEPLPYEHTFYRAFAKLGWLGVPIFFVVSGHCIRHTAGRDTSTGVFLRRRLIRIWPPYVASLAVVVAVAWARHVLAGANDVATLPRSGTAWLQTLLLLTAPATRLPTINWVYWSLTVEVAFYAVVGIALLSRRLTRPVLMVVCLAALWPTLHLLPGLFFLRHWPMFALGIATYELGRADRIWGFLIAGVSLPGLLAYHPTTAWLAALCAAAIIVLSTRGLIAWRAPVALVRVGEWSYSLYLLHVPIGVYVLVRFGPLKILRASPAHVVCDLLTLCGCIAAAALFSHAVEAPSIRASRWRARDLRHVGGSWRPAMD